MRDLAFEAVVQFLRKYGLPAMLTFDRDSRWVGSASRRDFRIAPAPLLALPGHRAERLPARADQTRIRLWRAIREPSTRSVSRSIGRRLWKRCEP